MRKGQSRLQKSTQNLGFRRYVSGTFVFVLAFFVAFLSSSLFMKAGESEANTLVASVTNALDYSMSVSSTDRLVARVTATSIGSTAVVGDRVMVESNVADGYKLYLGMQGADNSLWLNGDSESGTAFAATAGSSAAPAALGLNSWGYAVAGFGAFDASYNESLTNSQQPFAAVPVRGSEVVIAESDTTSVVGGDEVDVYYGIKADTTMPLGSYSGTITYSMVAQGSSLESGLAYVTPGVTYRIFGGEVMTITTGITATASSLIAAMEAGSSDPVYFVAKIGGRVCKPFGGEEDSQGKATGLSNDASGHLVVTCDSPDQDTGLYDLELTIPYNSASFFIANAVEYKQKSRYYEFFAIDYMQDMTPEICAEVPTPIATATIADNGGQSILYDDARIRGDGKSQYMARTTIKDKRTGRSYYIQKMMDGNCWMAQNLAIDGGTTLTSELSNVTAEYTMPESNSSTCSYDAYATCARMKNGVHTDNSLLSEGDYYDYNVATAGNGLAKPSNYTAPVDVCPKNWSLPNRTSFSSLYTKYGTTFPTYWQYKTTNDTWWTSTTSGTSDAYWVNYDGSSISNSARRNSYRSVRCVTKN